MLGQGGVSAVPGGAQGDYPQYHGIFYGAVSSNADPLKKNRCLLRVPQLLGSATTTWALPLTPLVDPPPVGTLVACLFVGGDIDNPVYLVVYPAVPIENVNGNVQPVGTTASAGTSHKVAAADHVHTLANALESTSGNIQPVTSGGSAAAGTSAKASRADHVHSLSNVLAAGSGGFLEIDSSTASVGDTQADIQLESRLAAGQTTINLNATDVSIGTSATGSITIDGNVIQFTGTSPILTGMNQLELVPVMATPSGWPYSTDTNTGSSWATGERSFINQLVNGLNDLVNSLMNRGLM
jgi:hypothetical protein